MKLEREADDSVYASNLEEMERAMCIRVQLERGKQPYSPHCVDCDVYIPDARQSAVGGTDRCVDCAE